jgi:hypothetical protein
MLHISGTRALQSGKNPSPCQVSKEKPPHPLMIFPIPRIFTCRNLLRKMEALYQPTTQSRAARLHVLLRRGRRLRPASICRDPGWAQSECGEVSEEFTGVSGAVTERSDRRG